MRAVLGVTLFCFLTCMAHAQLKDLPPTITLSPETEIWLPEKDTTKYRLDCEATGSGTITYSWHLNGASIESTENRKVNGGTILFERMRAEYFGKYQCFAENAFGKTMTPEIEIKKAADLNDFSIQNSGDVSVKLGNPAEIKCNGAPECVPKDKCNFEWKKGPGTDQSVLQNERIAVDAEGTLHFLYTESEDESSSQELYGCGLWYGVTQSLKKGSLTKLVFNSFLKPANSIVLKFSGDVKAHLGTTAVLECIFSGKPLPTVNWYRNGQAVDLNARISHGTFKPIGGENSRQLVIRNVNEEDEDEYTCEGIQEQVQSKGKVNLDVTGPPQFTEVMTQQIKPIGSRAVFKCKTRSLKGETPPDAPIWFEKGTRITSFGSNTLFSKSDDGTELYIDNLQKGFTTSVQCSVKNPIGTSYAESYVVVIEKTIIHEQPSPEKKIMPGDKISLFVNATTDPQFTLAYSWTFTDLDGVVKTQQDLEASDPFTITMNNRNLTIDASNLEGDKIFQVVGDYQVRIYHPFDQHIVTVNITTDSSIVKPGGQTVLSAGFDSWLFALIGGIIFLIIVIVLIVCLLHRNRGGDYNVDKKELAAGHDPAKELENGGLHELSRAYDDQKPNDDRLSLTENGKDLSSDDEDYREYDLDDDTGKFNEDGSFIGQYGDKRMHQPTQSTV